MRMLSTLALGLGLLVGNSLWAQDCEPDPRPAIFFEGFGSGPNPGNALPAGTTTFGYGSIAANRYVRSNTSALNSGFWHEGEDHTPDDEQGYMIIFNANGGPTVFYQSVFTDLCPNTDYIFTAYLANVVIPTACIGASEWPRVRFAVVDANDEAITLASSDQFVPIRSRLTFEPYVINFRTGSAQTAVHISLSNLAAGRCGNDLAMDDLSLSLCNPQVEQTVDLCDQVDGSFTLGSDTFTEPGDYLVALPIPNTCNDTLVQLTLTGERRRLPPLRFTACVGDTLSVLGQSFTADTAWVDTIAGTLTDCPFFQAYDIRLLDKQTTNQQLTICQGEQLQVGGRVYQNTGIYVDTLQTRSGCDSIVTTTLRVADIAVSVDPTSVSLEPGESAQLRASVSLTDTFTLAWQPSVGLSCTDCPDPLAQPTETQVYQVQATDLSSGCTATATSQVTILTCEAVFVPNAFSPNGDWVNDELQVFTEPCFTRLLQWRIFDRWGAEVFIASPQALTGTPITWDGWVRDQRANPGVYTYQLVLERDNGTLKEVLGEVVLLR